MRKLQIPEPYPGWLYEAVDTKEASRILGVPKATLVTYRSKFSGPKFFHPRGTRLVRYIRIDLYIWLMADGPKRNTADMGEYCLPVPANDNDGPED